MSAPTSGSTVPAPLAATSERKLVTVVFVAPVGAHDEDPEWTGRVLDELHSALGEELAVAGGTMERSADGSAMAVFGAPAAQEDHAERALHSLLAARERVDRLFGPRLSVRAGVESGEVVVDRGQTDRARLSGEPVVVAAQLLQAALPGQILVGPRTASAVKGAFALGAERVVSTPSEPAGVHARELGRALALRRARGVGSLGETFVGRQAELDLLEAGFRRVTDLGRPHVLTVIGDAGVGKTKLVGALEARLDASPAPPRWLSGRCLAYGRGITYWPLGDILCAHFGFARADPIGEIGESLEGRGILGLTLGIDVAGDLHPLAARDQLHADWVALVEELAAEAPLVLLVEDLHWADEPLLDLLDVLAAEVRAPLLLLATARPEFAELRPTWADLRRNGVAVWLEPLSLEDAESMIDDLLGGSPPGIRRFIAGRAEGNPFFVEEVIEELLDRGSLQESGADWTLDAAQSPAVPESIRTVIAARIDMLGPVEKEGLGTASVIGRTFATGEVSELLGGVVPDFGLLEDRGFLRRTSRSSVTEATYSFKHALTRDVAYAGLPKVERARLHAAFADQLVVTAGTGDLPVALVAHHYAEAVGSDGARLAWSDDPERLDRLERGAVEWLERASEVALAAFAIDEGLALLERALAFEPPAEVGARLWRSIGRAHALRYAGVAAVDAYQRAAALTADDGLRGEIYAELAFEAVQRYAMLNPMPARELVDGWIDAALVRAVPGSAAHARALIARSIWSCDSQSVADEAVAIADRLGDPSLQSYAYNGRACYAFVTHRYDESYEWADRRVSLADEISDPDHLVDIYGSLLPGLLGNGRFDEARRFAERHDQTASALSTHHRVHAVAMKLELEELTGRWELVQELQQRTCAVVEANADTPCIRNSRSLLVCAVADAYSGHQDRSRQLEQRSTELAMDGYDGTFAPLRIRLALARNELEILERLVADAVPPPPAKNWWALGTHAARLDAFAALGLQVEVEREARELLAPGTYLEPFALRALGLVRDDVVLVERALAAFEALGLDWHAGETRRMLHH